MRQAGRPARLVALSTAALLTVTLAPSQAIAGRNPARTDVQLPDLQKELPVPGADSTGSFQLPVAPGTQIEYEPTRITPINGGTEQIVLGATGSQSFSATTADAGADGMQQVASLPLWVGPAQTPAPPTGAQALAATTAEEPTGTWTVTVPDRAATEAAGIDGVLMKLEPSEDATAVDLKLKYEQFEQLYGGGWGSRLRLVQFPECFLTTPDVEGCSDATELPSFNNASSNEVSVTVTAADIPAEPQARSATAASGAILLAATGGASGESGDYKASPLQPSGKWTAGGSSGGFSWSYPIDVPPVGAGPKPALALGYSSQSVDGRTSTTNNQASWIGDGWDYHPGFVERAYRSCAGDMTGSNTAKKTGDLCWGSDNAVMSLNGSTVVLVKDASTGQWKPKNDNGTRIEQKFGAVNGDDNGEYWVVTTPDGTKYHFGLNRLPGWSDGKASTDSVFTVPVFGNQAGEPCHQSSYDASACDQAWRWNLDYVEDQHGNALAAYWKQERNWYAQAGKTDQPKPYVRGGWIDRIEYGLRADSVYTRSAPAKVTFTVDERCLRTSTFDCSDAKFTKHSTDGLHWPDVPVDSMCKDTGKCLVNGPTFWTRKWLTTITTQVATTPGTNAYRPVDSIELKHNFLDARYDTNPPAWLDSLQRTGHAADGSIAALPPVTFHANPVDMPNREYKQPVPGQPVDPRPPFNRLRVQKIFTETGGGINVTYSQPDPVCIPGATKPKPEQNTSRCYPVYWTPDGQDDPKIEWFNKYVVTQVAEEDFVGGAPPIVTQYRYLDASTAPNEPTRAGGAAWAKSEAEFSKPTERTWSDWRGYGRVQTVKGTTDPVMGTFAGLSETRYFRGLEGTAVKDSAGMVVADDTAAYQGLTAETVSYTSDGGQISGRTITTPWSRETAVQPRAGLPDLKAHQTGVQSTRAIQFISGNQQRSTLTRYEMDPKYPMVVKTEELGVESVIGDETCTLSTLAHNETRNILGAASQIRKTVGTCADAASAGADRVISDNRTWFDDLAFGASPIRGLVTRTDIVDGTGSGYVTAKTSVYDNLGRVVRETNAEGAATTTTYTPDHTTNDPVTKVVVTNPLGHSATTEYEIGRGQAIAKTNANQHVTRTAIDPLGRLAAVWTPARTGTTPNLKFTYDVSAARPTVVTTETVRDDGSYSVAKTFYDGMLRPRQTQGEAVGPGRLITDTKYNANGAAHRVNGAYLADGEPGNALYQPRSNTEVRSWTISSQIDDRTTQTALWFGGAQTPEHVTLTRNEGDYTVTVPPPGGIAQRVWRDAFDRVTKLDQFTDKVTTLAQVAQSPFTSTTYEYDSRGNRSKVVDASGNTWTWRYDARGQVLESVDPDKGRTTFTYDTLGRQTTTTDPRNITIATVYDILGRKTSTHEGSTTGPKLGEWTYDALGAGLSVKAISYDGANAYTSEVTGYDNEYRITGTKITIPAVEGPLAGTYTTSLSYTPTGKIAAETLPAVAGTSAERIITRYNSDGLPVTTSGADWYTSDTIYSPYGEVLRTQTGTAPARVWTTNLYNQNTGTLTSSTTHREAGTHLVGETTYAYDKSGGITAINARVPDGTGALKDDMQCFGFDALRRLTEAWTSTDRCASAPKTGAATNVGGTDPYWTSYTFDAVGNRLTETQHSLTGDPTKDITATSTLAPASNGNSHRLDAVTTVQPGLTQQRTFSYDAAGNTLTRQQNGDTQTLTWNKEGRLAQLNDPANGPSDYVYSADGNRLIQRTPKGNTLYLGSTEVTSKPGLVTVDRYYSHPGAPTVIRAAGNPMSALVADHHGSNTTAISLVADMPIQRRKLTLFGQPRTSSAAWPGTRGFVGGTMDSSGLTHLGAREYDPTLGRFISVDPVLDLADPQQIHGYTYANNNPVNFSDPDGLRPFNECEPFCTSPGTPVPIWAPSNGAPVTAPQPITYPTPAPVDPADPWVDPGGKDLPLPVKNQQAFKENYSKAYAFNIKHYTQGPEYKWSAQAMSLFQACQLTDGCMGSKLSKTYQNWHLEAKLATTEVGAIDGLLPPIMAAKLVGSHPLANAGCNSFTPDTPVLMADGTHKAIAEVEVGDLVLASDPQTGETSPRQVTALITGTGEKDLVEIAVDHDGDPGTAAEKITATAGHPFWVQDAQRWADAKDLAPGNWLRTAAGTYVQITAVQRWTEHRQVNNLTVEGLHTYYAVAGTSALLVHNTGGYCPRFVQEAWKNLAKKGDKTSGQLFDVNGRPIGSPLDSGYDSLATKAEDLLQKSPHMPRLPNPKGTYAASAHTETKYAVYMAQKGMTRGHVVINQTYMCGSPGSGDPYGCYQAVAAILPKGSVMTVHIPGQNPIPVWGKA